MLEYWYIERGLLDQKTSNQQTKKLAVEGAWLRVFFLRQLQSLRDIQDQRWHLSKMADAGDSQGQGRSR